jgi:general secretion pathway protein C
MINFETDVSRRFITALLVGGALLCAGYWARTGLSAGKTHAIVAAPTPPAVAAGTTAELARVLGAPRPALAGSVLGPAERFRVIGVLASASGQGAALISVDKQAPRPFRVGASVAPGFVLKAVKLREVTLEGSLQGELSLPLPDPATTKTEEPNTELRSDNALVFPPPQQPQPVPLPNTPEAEAGPPSILDAPSAP